MSLSSLNMYSRPITPARKKREGQSAKLTVCIRLRPLIEEDNYQARLVRNAPDVCVCLKKDGQTIKLVQDQYHTKLYKVDHTFDASSSQIDVYQTALRPVVRDVIEGYNGSGLVYGQTGSGKTYTMFGSESKMGLAHLAVQDIFDAVQGLENQGLVAKVFLSFYQIYVDQIYDLLPDPQESKAPSALCIREDVEKGVYVEGLTTLFVKDVDLAKQIIAQGLKHRRVHSTSFNFTSSRSHAVLQIYLDFEEPSANIIDNSMGVQRYYIRRRKLMLVDLAGSERVPAYRNTPKQQLKESQEINKSISALGNVITALANQAQDPNSATTHIPYRDSKLTRVLADSLGGNSKTCIMACIGPCTYQYEETKSTLKFATRAKTIRKKVSKAIPAEIIIRPPSMLGYDDLLSNVSTSTMRSRPTTPNQRRHSLTNQSVNTVASYDDKQEEEEESKLGSSSFTNRSLHMSSLHTPRSLPNTPSIPSSAQRAQMRSAKQIRQPSPPTSALKNFLSPYDNLSFEEDRGLRFSLKDFLQAVNLVNKAFQPSPNAPQTPKQEAYGPPDPLTPLIISSFNTGGSSPLPRSAPEPSPWTQQRSPVANKSSPRSPKSPRSPRSPGMRQSPFTLIDPEEKAAGGLQIRLDGELSESIVQTRPRPASPVRAQRSRTGSLDDFSAYGAKPGVEQKDQCQQTDFIFEVEDEFNLAVEEIRRQEVERISMQDPMELASQMWAMQLQMRKKDDHIKQLQQMILEL